MQKWLICFMVILYVLAADVWAQETGQAVAQLSNEYIKEWLVMGPFFPDDLDRDFFADVGAESSIQPQESDIIATAAGMELTWKHHRTKKYSVDLSDAIGYYEHAVAYAFCTLQSEVAGEAQVCFGHANGAVMWINGQRVYSNPVSAARHQSVFPVKLKAGTDPEFVADLCMGPVQLRAVMLHLPVTKKYIRQVVETACASLLV